MQSAKCHHSRLCVLRNSHKNVQQGDLHCSKYWYKYSEQEMITSISVIIWAATTSTSLMMMILMLFCNIMGCYFFANMRAWTYWSIGFVCYDYNTFDVYGSLVNLLRLIVNPGLESTKNSCSHSNMQSCLRSFCFFCAPNKKIIMDGMPVTKARV